MQATINQSITPACTLAQVYIPITELVENSPRSLNMRGRTWERVLTITRQPNTVETDAAK